MSDVRRVLDREDGSYGWCPVTCIPTHALVPWGVWERVIEHISNDECYCFELSGGTCHRCEFLQEIGGGG